MSKQVRVNTICHSFYIIELPHDKIKEISVRPAKIQISLSICPVWSESSLCAQWVAKGPVFLHADSEDSDQTGRMPRLIWVFAGRKVHFVGFVMRQLICWTLFCMLKPPCSNFRMITAIISGVPTFTMFTVVLSKYGTKRNMHDVVCTKGFVLKIWIRIAEVLHFKFDTYFFKSKTTGCFSYIFHIPKA